MFTTGSKWFFGLGLVSFVLAAAYGWTTGGNGLGPVTAGYNGGVGDHFGYAMLVSLGALATFLGAISLITRDADPSALAQLAGTDDVPAAVAPADHAYWPVLGALGAATTVLGLVISNVLFVASAFLLLAVLVEWMVLAWADRATGDPETNRVVRARLLGPYEVPLIGVLLAGGAVAAFSRVFLTSSKEGAVWVATAAGIVIFVIGAVIASRPQARANVVAGVLVVAALGVITGGVVAAARGERTIEPHHAGHGTEASHDEAEGEDDHGEATEGESPEAEEPHEADEAEEGGTGLRPYVPAGTNRATTTTEAEG